MNRRKIFFLAFAIALPLALLVPLILTRSRQPRVLPLAYRKTFVPGQRDVTNFFWRTNGLFLTRSEAPLHRKPLSVVKKQNYAVAHPLTKAARLQKSHRLSPSALRGF